MTDRLLLDTYIVLWLDSGDERLSITTRALIDDCWRNGGTLYFSAVTAWEIALLVDTGRVDLDSPPKEWVERFLDRPGIEPVPLGWRAACQALSTASSRSPRSRRSAADRDGDRSGLPARHL
ncbi:MAG: type II toxin-antitoxin system VapC family toxin [Stellaceae bacterium]